MKPRMPEGLFPIGSEEPKPKFSFEDEVYVQLWQRIPPGDKSGEWKDTGQGFHGLLVDGPSSRLQDPVNGQYWYVMPHEKFAHDDQQMGNIHPRPISEQPFEVHVGEAESDAVETLRFVVVAVGRAIEDQA